MPNPPAQLKAELYPLRHKFGSDLGLSLVTTAANSSMITIVKNYKSANNPDTINVNPHHASFARETGAICAPMSVIDNIKISMTFTLTEDAITDGVKSAKVKYMPIMNSFSEKMESVDDKTTTTAKAVLELTADATEEDVTPLYTASSLAIGAGAVTGLHPASSVNFTEVFGTMNLSVNTSYEEIAWDNKVFFDAMKYYTNKGAIRSMVGRQRTILLTDTQPTKSVFINKFPPRAVRRIMPYSFFGMLLHAPLDSEVDQAYYSGIITAAKAQIGIKFQITYDEWNLDHLQEMM